VPFAIELLPGFQVGGTWNVLTTLKFVVCDFIIAAFRSGVTQHLHVFAFIKNQISGVRS
jgi:hypothetical protein